MRKGSQALFFVLSFFLTHSLFADEDVFGADFNQYAANQSTSEIQGTDAGGAKQMTVIDANGNLKIVGGPKEQSDGSDATADDEQNNTQVSPSSPTSTNPPPVENEEIKPSSTMPGPNATTTSPSATTELSPAQSAAPVNNTHTAVPGKKTTTDSQPTEQTPEQNLKETTGLMPQNPSGTSDANQPKPVVVQPSTVGKVFNPQS